MVELGFSAVTGDGEEKVKGEKRVEMGFCTSAGPRALGVNWPSRAVVRVFSAQAHQLRTLQLDIGRRVRYVSDSRSGRESGRSRCGENGGAAGRRVERDGRRSA